MVINKTIRLETHGCRKKKYYESIGYDTSNDYIEVRIEHLTPGSRHILEVQCDFCDNISKITNKEYRRNISLGGRYSCCKKCGSEKAKLSNIDKYGVSHPMMSDVTQAKARKTNLKRYGVEFLQQSPEMQERSRKTLLEKYGVNHISKAEIIRMKTSKISSDDNYIKYIGDNESLFICDICDNEFYIRNDNYYTRTKSGIALCTICNPIGDSQSIKEKMLSEFITSIYGGEIIQSYRDGLEIDVYLPELNLGFEFNGLYWHSEKYKDKNYHLDKTKYFRERGIRIIHIWEDDWVNKRDILKSQISNLVGSTTNRIFARKCKVGYIDNCTKFLNDNHVQGVDRSVVKIGLFYNGELVSVMTFNRLEGRKSMLEGEWNLSRFCNKIGYSIIGGASKLLKNFIKDNNATRIISYADCDWSVGNLYEVLGFTLLDESGPDYKYVVDGLRRHKQNYKKSNLGIQGGKVTEKQHMTSLGYYRIWDCGKIKFEKR